MIQHTALWSPAHLTKACLVIKSILHTSANLGMFFTAMQESSAVTENGAKHQRVNVCSICLLIILLDYIVITDCAYLHSATKEIRFGRIHGTSQLTHVRKCVLPLLLLLFFLKMKGTAHSSLLQQP